VCVFVCGQEMDGKDERARRRIEGVSIVRSRHPAVSREQASPCTQAQGAFFTQMLCLIDTDAIHMYTHSYATLHTRTETNHTYTHRHTHRCWQWNPITCFRMCVTGRQGSWEQPSRHAPALPRQSARGLHRGAVGARLLDHTTAADEWRHRQFCRVDSQEAHQF